MHWHTVVCSMLVRDALWLGKRATLQCICTSTACNAESRQVVCAIRSYASTTPNTSTTSKYDLTCPNAPAAAALHWHAEHEQKHRTEIVEVCLDRNATRSQRQESPVEQAHGGSGLIHSSWLCMIEAEGAIVRLLFKLAVQADSLTPRNHNRAELDEALVLNRSSSRYVVPDWKHTCPRRPRTSVLN
jgi:uncharacterized membrane protein